MDNYLHERRVSIKREIMSHLENQPGLSEEEIMSIIDEFIAVDSREHFLSIEQKKKIRKELFASIRQLDILQELIDDNRVTEIMVNGKDHIFIEREGRIYETDLCFESEERLHDIIQKIVASANRTVNLSTPIVDARLNGSRVNVVLSPVSVDGSVITIRRFPDTPMRAEDLIANGSLTLEALNQLNILVEAGYNMLISGSTGAGKTTFLNIMSGFIPKDERIITIEDSAELRITGISNLVRLETRNANADGCKEITIRDLIKCSLRMRPDRIIVGEVRGAEAIDMLQALNVGSDGSLSTIHANSAIDALSRLETMVMLSTDIPQNALLRQIASGIDIVVHLGRLRDKSRHVLEIIEVLGIKDHQIETSTLFQFEEKGEYDGKVRGELVRKNPVQNKQKLMMAGFLDEL